MPRFWVKICEGLVEVEDAADEDDARAQALEQVETEIVEVERGEEDDEDNNSDPV